VARTQAATAVNRSDNAARATAQYLSKPVSASPVRIMDTSCRRKIEATSRRSRAQSQPSHACSTLKEASRKKGMREYKFAVKPERCTNANARRDTACPVRNHSASCKLEAEGNARYAGKMKQTRSRSTTVQHTGQSGQEKRHARVKHTASTREEIVVFFLMGEEAGSGKETYCAR